MLLMTGYSIPWTHEKDSIRLFLCLYLLAAVTCLNLTIYRRCNNHLNTKGNVLGQEIRGTKDLEQICFVLSIFNGDCLEYPLEESLSGSC